MEVNKLTLKEIEERLKQLKNKSRKRALNNEDNDYWQRWLDYTMSATARRAELDRLRNMRARLRKGIGGIIYQLQNK